MAKCTLDLRSYFNNNNEFVNDAYSLTLNSRDSVIELLDELENNQSSMLSRPVSSVVIEEKDILPGMQVFRSGFNDQFFTVRIYEFLRSIIEWKGGQLSRTEWNFKLDNKQTSLVYTRKDPNTNGYDSNDRINLASVGGDPCKRGYYGFVADRISGTLPVFEICYISRDRKTNPLFANMTNILGIGTVKKLREENYEIIENERGPIIITDDIFRRTNTGISIVDDLQACPPLDPGVFFATDVKFREVKSGSISVKDVFLYNYTIPTPPNTGDVVLLDVNPKEHPNFRILDFNWGGGFPQLTKSPLDLPTNPLTIPINQYPPVSFQVEYDPKNEIGVQHEMELTYLVKTGGKSPLDVFEEKLTTKITGVGYRAEVSCSDVNWGKVDVFNFDNKKNLVIQNIGSKDVYLYEISISGNSSNFFNIDTKINVSKTNPLKLSPNQTTTLVLNYNPNGITGIDHTAFVNFKFLYDDPVLGTLAGEVTGRKLISYLNASAYSDPIDDIIDDVTGIITEDPNGVFVTKVLSTILDKSITVQKNRTFPLWRCVGDRLYEIYTGSNGTKMDKYYLPVYNKPVGEFGSEHQFDISYGHINGSGSLFYNENDPIQLYPSKAMYRKYLIECYGQQSGSFNLPKKFVFRNGVESDSVYFIQLDRDEYRDMLDPGNFEISLVPLSSSVNQLYNTGSNFYVNTSSSIVYKLIDDSTDTKQDRTDRSGLESFYYIVSGSLELGVYGEPNENVWGAVYPKMGLIVLDGNVLDKSCSFNTVTSSIDGDNIYKLFLSLSGSLTISDARQVSQSMYARSAERSMIQTYFCRANPDEFNYSTNPTFVSGSLNSIKYSYFIKEPKTYITSIGLYNRRNELLAIGKLQKPLLKTDKTQYVFQVRVRVF